MKRLLLLCFFSIAMAGVSHAGATKMSKVYLSPVYDIDQKYRSMEGPMSSDIVRLADGGEPEVYWVTGVRVEMMQADGTTPALPELMCHVNLDLDLALHGEIFGGTRSSTARILTLSQGQLSATYPEGFGLPVASTEPLSLATQVLNLNIENAALKVRHKVTIDYVRERDLTAPMKPVFNTGVFGMALVEGPNGLLGKPLDMPVEHGASCLMRTQASNGMGGSDYVDEYGRRFTGHWTVPPGREENRTNVTRLLALPFNTTLHAAAVHLHPFAQSLELKDLTTGATVFKSVATNEKGKIGLVDVTSYADPKGIPLLKGHEYEIVSVYDNPTRVDQDSMAVMYLSPLDKAFEIPSKAHLKDIAPKLAPVRTLTLTTAEGDLVFELLGDIAPRTVAQISSLVKSGIYDGMPFARLEKGFIAQTAVAEARPLTEAQKALLQPIVLEKGGSPVRGSLIMGREDGKPDSAVSSFGILLSDSPHLHDGYTIFARLIDGWPILDSFDKVPVKQNSVPTVPIAILRAEVGETKLLHH